MEHHELPVDKGWSWMLVLGAGVCMFFYEGTMYCSGILVHQLIDQYQVSAISATSVIGVGACVVCITSAVAQVLASRFTFRVVIMTGGFLFTLSLVITAFAQHISIIYFAVGVVMATSYGFIFGPPLVALGPYFVKRKSLANGIANASGSVGQMLLPVFMAYVLNEYGYTGGVLMYAAVGLHVCAAGALFRPHSYYIKDRSPPPVPAPSYNNIASTDSVIREAPLSNGVVKALSKTQLNLSTTFLNLSTSKLNISSNKLNKDEDQQSILLNADPSESSSDSHDSETSGTCGQVCCATFCCCCSSSEAKPLLEWSLFRQPMFTLYVIGVFMGSPSLNNTITFMPNQVMELGYTKQQASYLMSITGGMSVVTQITAGWFADLGYVRRYSMMAVSTLIAGVTTLTCTFINSYEAFACMAVVLGISYGVYYAIFMPVIQDIVGLEKFSSASGLVIMFMFAPAVPLPVATGFLKDHTGDYLIGLFMTGTFMLVSGISLSCMRIIESKKEKDKIMEPTLNGNIKMTFDGDEKVAPIHSIQSIA